MSEFRELPGAEVYESVLKDMYQDGSDLYEVLKAFKKRHEASQSFYFLATSASRAGLYFEDFQERSTPLDPDVRRAKAFVNGILTAEMINMQLFDEEFRHTAFIWLMDNFSRQKDLDPSGTVQSHIQDQLSGTEEIFTSGLLTQGTELLETWSHTVVDPEQRRYFRIGAGVNMAAAYSYQSYKNDMVVKNEIKVQSRDG